MASATVGCPCIQVSWGGEGVFHIPFCCWHSWFLFGFHLSFRNGWGDLFMSPKRHPHCSFGGPMMTRSPPPLRDTFPWMGCSCVDGDCVAGGWGRGPVSNTEENGGQSLRTINPSRPSERSCNDPINCESYCHFVTGQEENIIIAHCSCNIVLGQASKSCFLL